MLKQRIVGDTYWCLTAGFSHDIFPLVQGLTRRIGTNCNDETQVLAGVRDALTARKREKAEEFISARYAMTYDEFIATGKDKLPPDLFAETWTRIYSLTLGAEFIVAGFSDFSYCLIETSDSGEVKLREDFAVVGSGSSLAQASLLHRNYSAAIPMSQALYCVYEAKRYAERAPGVGEATLIQVMYPDGNTAIVSQPGIDLLDENFAKFGPQRMPDDFKVNLASAIKPMRGRSAPSDQ